MKNLILLLSIVLVTLATGCITDSQKSTYYSTPTTSEMTSTTTRIVTTTLSATSIEIPKTTVSTTTTTTSSITTTIITTTTTIQPLTTTSSTSTTTIKNKTTSTTTTTLKKTTTTTTKTTTTIKSSSTTTTLKISKNSDIVISAVQFDAPGDDRKKENLNGEWVGISNNGNSAIDLTEWTLNDNENHVYNFPSNFKIKSGNSVKIHTGSGADTESDLYWNSGRPIWNNDGDTATLKDKNGKVIDEMSG